MAGIPVIGLTCGVQQVRDDAFRYFVNSDYVQSVTAAGGLPLLLPPLETTEQIEGLFGLIDGLLLPGGNDLDPAYFGEEPLPALGEIEPERDRLEVELTRRALRYGMPVLGICRGIQVLNVAAGGSLYQDIGTQVKGALRHYQQAPRWYASHEVHIQPGSKLWEIMQVENLRVNSFHHQAVKVVGDDVLISAKARDGVIEGIESHVHPFAVGVQWHPECMWQRERLFLRLFTRLVEEAARYAERRRAGLDIQTGGRAVDGGKNDLDLHRLRGIGGNGELAAGPRQPGERIPADDDGGGECGDRRGEGGGRDPDHRQ